LVLAEEVFVAREGFEEAFRRAREAGVLFEKLPLSRVSLSPSLDMRRVVVTYTPEKDPFPVRCEAHWLVPVSRKTCVLPPFDKVLLSDREVVLELPENPNLHPFATNIPGVFVAWGDVEDLVVTVSRYLEEGSIQEEGRVRVDAERCALCLTCLRSCPTEAIGLSGDLKRCIAVNEALCARCGICAGLCPAKAITFEVVHRVLGNHRL
jgi:ferredoxin